MASALVLVLASALASALASVWESASESAWVLVLVLASESGSELAKGLMTELQWVSGLQWVKPAPHRRPRWTGSFLCQRCCRRLQQKNISFHSPDLKPVLWWRFQLQLFVCRPRNEFHNVNDSQRRKDPHCDPMPGRQIGKRVSRQNYRERQRLLRKVIAPIG